MFHLGIVAAQAVQQIRAPRLRHAEQLLENIAYAFPALGVHAQPRARSNRAANSLNTTAQRLPAAAGGVCPVRSPIVMRATLRALPLAFSTIESPARGYKDTPR